MRRGRLIEDGFLGGQDFVIRRLVERLDVLQVERRCRSELKRGAATLLQHLELPQLAFQSFAAAAQRLIDGLGR